MTKNMIHRSNCVVRQTSPDLFTLHSYENDITEWQLDSTGIWIWSLLNDRMELDDLISRITKQFPSLSPNNAQTEINNWLDNRLFVELTDNDKTASSKTEETNKISNLNVHLSSTLADSLHEPRQSYLLYLLWHMSETVTIVDEPEQADMVFSGKGIDHSAKQKDTLYILVDEAPEKDDVDKFDYIISSKYALSPHHLKWLRIPDEVFGTGFCLSTTVATLNTKSGYNIERLADKFSRFLVGSTERVDSTEQIGSPEKPFLSIGMATYDDYDGVYFSVTSLMLHQPASFTNSEIIILDNNPNGKIAPHLKKFADGISNVRYVPYDDTNSTAVRDIIFKVARGEWVVCMDSHVMLPPDTLSRLTDYMSAHPDSKDLLQGPLLNDSGKILGSHFKGGWSSGMYGSWGMDERAKDIDNEPFEIEMQGLGIFACRKNAWPGFNKLFSGFGGEEGYIHQKIRNQGGKCLCLPFFRWAHRFARPNGALYPLKWIDRIKNYLIGFAECGLDTQQIETHFTELLNPEVVQQAKDEVAILTNSPLHGFEYAVCINLDSEQQKWQAMQARFNTLGIANKVKRFSAIATPEFHHTGRALSHRKIVAHAKKFGYKNVLVFEDDALMLPGCEIFLTQALQELEGKDWKLLYLGGADYNEIKLDDCCQNLKTVTNATVTTSNALAYHESIYDEILKELPDNEDDMAEWLVDNIGLDQYFYHIDKRYIVHPKLFTQPSLQKSEDEPYRYFYK